MVRRWISGLKFELNSTSPTKADAGWVHSGSPHKRLNPVLGLSKDRGIYVHEKPELQKAKKAGEPAICPNT